MVQLKQIGFLVIAPAAIAGSIALSSPVGATETIDTTPAWNGLQGVALWSPSGTESYGQIITPLASGFLTDFTVYIAPNSIPNSINYRAHVYQWDYTGGPGLSGPTGSSLYESGTLVFSVPTLGFTTVTIPTGAVKLNGGTPYVFFLSTLGEGQVGNPHSTVWGFIFSEFSVSDAYPGGKFVFSNDDVSYLAPWDGDFGPLDLAFKANIADVPGPLPLFGAAAAYGWSRKIRKRILQGSEPLE